MSFTAIILERLYDRAVAEGPSGPFVYYLLQGGHMKIILGTRQSGKTHDLIRISERTGSTIVTFDRRSLDHIKRLAKEMNASIPEPIAYKDLAHYRREHAMKSIVIDDLDALLVLMFNIKIEAVSISIEGEHP